MGTESAIVEPPGGGLFGKGGYAVVFFGVVIIDKQLIVAVFATGRAGFTGINIESAIAVYIGEGHAGGPDLPDAETGFFGDIFKFKIAAIEIKPVGSHVAAQENIGQAVVIYVADTDPAAVVEIAKEITVEGIGIGYVVAEVDAGLGSVEQGETGRLAGRFKIGLAAR